MYAFGVCECFFSLLSVVRSIVLRRREFLFFISFKFIALDTDTHKSQRNEQEPHREKATTVQRNRNQIRRRKKITTKFITIKKNLLCNCSVAFGVSASKLWIVLYLALFCGRSLCWLFRVVCLSVKCYRSWSIGVYCFVLVMSANGQNHSYNKCMRCLANLSNILKLNEPNHSFDSSYHDIFAKSTMYVCVFFFSSNMNHWFYYNCSRLKNEQFFNRIQLINEYAHALNLCGL